MPNKVELDYNKIYHSNNYGPFKIINDEGRVNGRRRVKIKFINTGYETEVILSNIYKGNVKDNSIKPIRDISCFPLDRKEKFIINKLHVIWTSMLYRCEDPNHKEFYAYGGIGVYIDPSWKNFDTFLNDCRLLYQYDKFYNDPYNYQLDKDYLQLNRPKNMRIYSKDTCIFISNRNNINLRVIEYNKSHNLTSPYFGVCKIKNKYYMGITCNTYTKSMYFDDEIAAANAYNYWFEKLHLYDLVPLINNVPYMTIEEWSSHIISKKEIIKFV